MKKLNWKAIWFVGATHLIGLIGWPVWVYFNGTPQWQEISVAIFMYALALLGINFGYHRALSHRAFQMAKPLKFLALFGGASAGENSALAWCADHRRHHRYEDQEKDPYNIKKGFWWAHMGWMLMIPSTEDFKNCPDLMKDPMIKHQHDHYAWWLAISCFGLPLAIGFAIGRPIECLLLGGFTRLMLVNQFTYCVNSLAHYVGSRPYSTTITARESGLVALLTGGEGYHNFHHRFPFDYRNGHKWYHYDPVKWMIAFCAKMGWASNLKQTPATEIYRARIQAQQARIKVQTPQVLKHNEMIERALGQWHSLTHEIDVLKKSWDDRYHEKLAHLQVRCDQARREFKEAYRQWKASLPRLQTQTSL